MSKKHLKRACLIMGSQSKLAGKLKVSKQAISKWLVKNNLTPIFRAFQIEKITESEVTAKQLRPDYFKKI